MFSMPLQLMKYDELKALFDAMPPLSTKVISGLHVFEKDSGDLWRHREVGQPGNLTRDTDSVLNILIDNGSPVEITISSGDEGLSR